MRYFNLIKNIANWPAYFLYRLFGLGGDPLTFVTRSGIKIEVPVRIMHDFKAVFFAECYTSGMSKPLPLNADIVDVGANIGSFTFFAAARFPGSRILSFEPDPTNFRQLERNASLNPGRAQVMRMAVAGVSGEAMLSGGNAESYTTHASIVSKNPTAASAPVVAISLADLFTNYGVERCGLLKLDCEGAEFPILYAAPDWALKRVEQMVMELHPGGPEGPNSRRGVERFLNGKGFKTRTSRDGLLWAWHYN